MASGCRPSRTRPRRLCQVSSRVYRAPSERMALRTVRRSGAWSRRWTATKPTSRPNQRILTAMASAASSHGEGAAAGFIRGRAFRTQGRPRSLYVGARRLARRLTATGRLAVAAPVAVALDEAPDDLLRQPRRPRPRPEAPDGAQAAQQHQHGQVGVVDGELA